MTTHTYTYRAHGSFWGMFLILIGALLLLDNLHIFSFDVWGLFFPLLLILIGVRIFIRRRQRIEINIAGGRERHAAAPPNTAAEVNAAAKVIGTPDEYINDSMVAGEIDQFVQSKSFRGGNLSNVFGPITIELTSAALAEGEQHLALSTVFGDVKIVAPKTIELAIEATTVFGDVQMDGSKRGGVFSNVSFTTNEYKNATTKLHIVASTVFGEVKLLTRD